MTGSEPVATRPDPERPEAPETPDPLDPDPDVDGPWSPRRPDDPSPVAPNPAPGTGDDPQPRRDIGSADSPVPPVA